MFDDRILGGRGFVERILSLAGHAEERKQKPLAEIIEQVAACLGVESTGMRRPGRERALPRAKAVVCYVAVGEHGLKGMEVASVLSCTPGAVSHAAKRGEQILRQEEGLQAKLGLKV